MQLPPSTRTTVPLRRELDDPAVADVGDGHVPVRQRGTRRRACSGSRARSPAMPAWPYVQIDALRPQRDLGQGVVELLVGDDRVPAGREERVVGAAERVVAPDDLAGRARRSACGCCCGRRSAGSRGAGPGGPSAARARRRPGRCAASRRSLCARSCRGRRRRRRRRRRAAAGEERDRGAEHRDQRGPNHGSVAVTGSQCVVEPGVGERVGRDRDRDAGGDRNAACGRSAASRRRGGAPSRSASDVTARRGACRRARGSPSRRTRR